MAKATAVKQEGESGTAELQKSLQKESERAGRLEQELALARSTKDTPAVAPPANSAPAEDGWIVSQTTSPVDYTPIATATISSREAAAGSAMQLSIRCRGGRTQLTVAGHALPGRGDGYVVSYRVRRPSGATRR